MVKPQGWKNAPNHVFLSCVKRKAIEIGQKELISHLQTTFPEVKAKKKEIATYYNGVAVNLNKNENQRLYREYRGFGSMALIKAIELSLDFRHTHPRWARYVV